MKTRDRYLSGILLVLIGVVIGTLFAFYQQQNSVNDNAEVDVTQVEYSEKPLFSAEDLEQLDARFLFKQVAERVTPTVVYIETVVPFSHGDMPDDANHDKEGFWSDIFPRRARTVGSGVIISSDGYILTNNHVIDGAVDGKIEVSLNDKRTFKGRIVGQDPTTDLAVLKIGAKDLPSITFGNSNEVNVGEWVLAIGNPFRLRSTVTAGIVSALSRDVQIINDQMRVESFIQTDAAINKGNSGGALVNTSGELIGVNTAIASQSGNYQGYGFAVPSNLASKVAQDIIEYGEVRRALLGVTIVTVDARLAEQLDMDKIRGVYITHLTPGGAADKAGLQSSDVILSVDGIKVNEANQLQQKIAVRKPGDIVDIQLLREGKEISKEVKLDLLEANNNPLAAENRQQSESPPSPDEEGNLSEAPGSNGVQFETFDFGMRVMAIPGADGSGRYNLVVTDVVAGSRAARKGMEEGYKIRKVGKHKVEDLETLKDLIAQFLEDTSSVTLEVENSEGERHSIELQQ